MSYFSCLFYFTSPKADLIEVKRNDLAESSPKSDIYKWLLIDNGVVHALTFESMMNDERNFKEGTLKFDDDTAILTMDGKEISFERKKPDLVPNDLRVRITNYLG